MNLLIEEQYRNASGIYIIRNNRDNRVYVGSALNFRRRFNLHLKQLKNGEHHCKQLQGFVKEHSLADLNFCLYKLCEPEDCLRYEQQALDEYKAGNPITCFNASPTAGSTKGVKHTAEARANMSASRIGTKRSLIAREKSRQSMLGHKWSDEQIEKMKKAKRVIPEDKVLAIKAAFAIGSNCTTVSKMFGISTSAARRIKNGKAYV